MSHQPKRTEKDCLNCGTITEGPFCHVCGQENIVPHQSFIGLTRHFIYDIFHFDGKFFETLKLLAFYPGKIAKEYVQGKRMKYLDPIRMYLFTSAIFFLVFFSITSTKDGIEITGIKTMSRPQRFEASASVNQQLNQHPGDTVLQKKLNILLDTGYSISLVNPSYRFTDNSRRKKHFDSTLSINLGDSMYYMMPEKVDNDPFVESADSSWLSQRLANKWKTYKEKFNGDDNAMLSAFLNSFLHKFPYLLFISLPVFALILKLLYIRRKNFYYSDHAIFTLYHYIFSFILLLLIFAFSSLEDWLGWSIFNWLNFALIIFWMIYLYKGLKRFYAQSRAKTVLKFILLNVFGIVSITVLLLIFLIFTAFQI